MTGPASLEILRTRSGACRAVRDFFFSRDFIEVDTPVRIPSPAPEEHIEAEPAGDWFLRTSPELQMKRLLAAGAERVFQLGPCFRRDESGPMHNPEFTMLEWYRANADYLDILADTKSLVAAVATAITGRTTVSRHGRVIELMPCWEIITVRDAFLEWAGWDPLRDQDPDRFDMDLVCKVEPRIAERDHPVILKDYPVHGAALARCRQDDPPCAERWELYIAGIELANAFSELTDASEQRRRFETATAARTARGMAEYPPDADFLEDLDRGRMPRAGGIALGMDRLVMLLAAAPDVASVRGFV
ncbi:MAG: EF-P lysine aminoacylase GenX [Lentisphaerae bacterium]|nr:EF-P lysine aminoacylase GenX [Lentisphaerota bacterium]